MNDPKWYIIGIVLQLAVAAVQGLIAWMGKRIIDAQDQRIREQGERQQRLEERQQRIEERQIAREEFERIAGQVDDAVTKEEWLRSYGVTQQLLREMSSKIDELGGKQSAAVEIATAMAAAINQTRKNAA
jgi:hypothetical protein